MSWVTLRERQSLFARLVARLIEHAFQMGYEVTFGEAWRTPEQSAWNAANGKGISNSLHKDRLAIDLNLYRDGTWLQNSADHKPLGDWWKQQHPDARWGGDFQRADGNHYSLAYEGRA